MIYVSNGYNTKLQYGKEINLEPPHWISGVPEMLASEEGYEIAFKTRHSPEFNHGYLFKKDEDNWLIESDTDIQGIAPGQFAIIYSPDTELCLGSAMIIARQGKKRRNHSKNMSQINTDN